MMVANTREDATMTNATLQSPDPGNAGGACQADASGPASATWLYRSEAFFEDLEIAPALPAQSARAAGGGSRGGLNGAWGDLLRAADVVLGSARLGRQGA
jgi:hypothetical protein